LTRSSCDVARTANIARTAAWREGFAAWISDVQKKIRAASNGLEHDAVE
jgi:hypothetical protein